MKKRRYQHVIQPEFVGLATLTVDYLSRWGEEVEALSLFLATLIIALLLDLEGILDNIIISLTVGVIVAAEFIYIIVVALRRRVLEYDLWRAVYQMADSGNNSLSDDGTSPGNES